MHPVLPVPPLRLMAMVVPAFCVVAVAVASPEIVPATGIGTFLALVVVAVVPTVPVPASPPKIAPVPEVGGLKMLNIGVIKPVETGGMGIV